MLLIAIQLLLQFRHKRQHLIARRGILSGTDAVTFRHEPNYEPFEFTRFSWDAVRSTVKDDGSLSYGESWFEFLSRLLGVRLCVGNHFGNIFALEARKKAQCFRFGALGGD